MKTNAARILDGLGIRYELRDYEVDEEDLSAETVARKVGLPPEQVFKTLVARGDRNGVCLAVVPGNAMLDLKALAKLTGGRKVDTVSLKEVQPLNQTDWMNYLGMPLVEMYEFVVKDALASITPVPYRAQLRLALLDATLKRLTTTSRN